MKALTSHWQILFFIGILANYLIGIFLEIDYQSCIELSACQVIRYSILLVVDVGDPVIGTDIFYIEQVKYVHSDPDIFQVTKDSAVHDRIGSSGQLVREAEIDTFVGRRAESTLHIFVFRAWCNKRKSAGEDAFQIQFYTFVSGKIILKE